MQTLSTAFSSLLGADFFALLTASLVVLLAAAVAAGSIRRLGKSHRANALHAEKVAAYQLFTDLWGTLLRSGALPEGGGPYPWQEERRALDRLMALCGSRGVLRAYAAFRASAGEGGADGPRLRSQFAETLLEMRRDLGSEARALTAQGLQQLFFTNTQEVFTNTEEVFTNTEEVLANTEEVFANTEEAVAPAGAVSSQDDAVSAVRYRDIKPHVSLASGTQAGA